MRTEFKLALAAAVFVPTFSAQAALVDWGTQAGSAVADCPSFCTNFTFGGTVGGVGVADSGESSVATSKGSARAAAALAGGLNTPILKAEGFANAGFDGGFGTAFAVQGYTYNGPGETLTLDVTLDAIVSDPEMDAGETNSSLEVVFYSADNFFFTDSRGTLDFEFGAMPLMQPASAGGGEASIELQVDHTTASTVTGQIQVDVVMGQEFYLWALLRSEAESGAAATSADSFNTGTMAFQGSPNLTPAGGAPIPVPAAFWLMSGALAFLARTRRA